MRRGADVEQVHHRQRLVHSHERLVSGEIGTADEGQVRRVGELVAIDDEPERAVHGRERPLGDALDQALGAASVLDQIGDRSRS
jgi:hypothetical protein